MAPFHFRHFDIDDYGCGMKICSDSVLLAAWFLPPYADSLNVADIGAGSGLLSLLAADILPDATITAVEIDTRAAEAAARNFANSPWADRLSVINIDFQHFITDGNRYDIVISNPPYFSTGEKSADASRALARHAATLSYRSLIEADMLKPSGHLGLVAPAEAEEEIIYHATVKGLELRRLCRVSTAYGKAPSRILADFSHAPGHTHIETLSLRQADGRYTDSYIHIVDSFYTKIR